MIRQLFFWVCIFFTASGFAQQPDVLAGLPQQRLQHTYVLPDKQYTFEQVRNDSTLPFTATRWLEPTQGDIFWIKLLIDNPSQYTEKYTFYQQPFIDNTIYYFDYDQKTWIATRTGSLVPGKTRRYGMATCVLQGKTVNTVYIKADISFIKKHNRRVLAAFNVEQAATTQNHEQWAWLFSLGTILVVSIFLFYNGLIYAQVKDKAYLYYLAMQLGGILYVAGNFYYFVYLIPWRQFTTWVSPGGVIYYYHLNTFIQRMSTVIILTGFVQFTRAYNQTRFTLPKMDKWLKYLLLTWVLFEVAYNLINLLGIAYLDIYTIRYSNLFVVLIICSILATAIVATVKRLPAARYFLWSNAILISLMIAIAVYYMVMPNGSRNFLLPCIAIISQALMFAIALLERVRFFKKELTAKQTEAENLKTEIEQLEQKHEALTKAHAQIQAAIFGEKTKNEQLASQLAANQRELASAALYISQKNELLAGLKKQLQNPKQLPQHIIFKNIQSDLKNNTQVDEGWEKFKLHFEQVHPSFFANLQSQYPDLTPYELRLCAYLQMNLSTKEIAGLLNIHPDSVRKAKTRLGKKMDLTRLGRHRA